MAPATATPQTDATYFDLALHAKGQGFALTTRNRGVTLSDERLDWVFEGRADAVRLDAIVAVHLQTGGAWTEEAPVAMCRITFRDGYTLTVSDADKAGFKDDVQALAYRGFVRDLHARLAHLNSTVRFTAGYGATQFQVIALCALLLGAMGFGIPVVLFFIRPDLEILLVLFGGLGLSVPLFTMLFKNSPRRYEPTHIPTELLP
ncbi:MAG: hypothetical protein JO000_13935 [Alphaproteobacteria bacterium]|nr:hypothetical protein [Alphaproteobacteria bacterium]